MNQETLINCFGHSFHSEPLINYIKKLDVKYPKNPFIDDEGFLSLASASNAEKNIHLSFEGANDSYPYEFGTPVKTTKSDDEELILMGITIEVNSLNAVFDLKIGDSLETIISKIGRKPNSKEKHPGSTDKINLFYNFDNYKLQIHLSSKNEIVFIRAKQYNKSEKFLQELNSLIKEQKKNIKAEIINNYDFSFLNNWQLENKPFNSKLTSLLKEYIGDLNESIKKRSSRKIYLSTIKLVKQINKLNAIHNLIETQEREDLCHFIEESIEKTGFKIPSSIDITEEFRLW